MVEAIRKSARNVTLLLAGLTAMIAGVACENETIFEGEPVVAPPAVAFDTEETSASAIHGGTIRIVGTADDPYVGVERVDVSWTGALTGEFERTYPDHPEQVRIDTTLAVPFGTDGTVEFRIRALNEYGSTAESDHVEVLVVAEDTIRPSVGVRMDAADPMALSDTLWLDVEAYDDEFGSGLGEVGYQAVLRPDSDPAIDIDFRETLAGADTTLRRFPIALADHFTPATRPDTLQVDVRAFAVDQAGNCGAAVTEEPTPGLCEVGADGTVQFLVDPASTGTAVAADLAIDRDGGTVRDLAVDERRGRVYLSNTDLNAVEVYDFLAEPGDALLGAALVGAHPWGMTLDRTGDTLLVANSGGTSLSFVNLETLAESRRYETPNSAVLYTVDWTDITVTDRGDTLPATVVSWDQFSDRPQYIAQDEAGVTFYSTLPTGADARGTIRIVESDPAWRQHEANLMLWTDVVVEAQDSVTAIFTAVDSIRIRPESVAGGPWLAIYDHMQGHPNQIIADSTLLETEGSVEDVATRMAAAGSDIIWFNAAQWDYSYWHTPETTRIATSPDASTLAFAEEGGENRVWTWNASSAHPGLANRFISGVVAIEDLQVNGAMAPLVGIAADETGDRLASRGQTGVAFFNQHLRLDGEYTGSEVKDGAGLAFHPTRHLAFIPTADSRLVIVEGTHYRAVGALPLSAPLVGELRLSMPRGDDDPALVARIHGINANGALVMVPVHENDFQQP
ncbi:MAG: YncE family protein [Gemmatimonadota bacterium]